MDINGAKFQEHCFNISRDIVNSVFTTFIADLICIVEKKPTSLKRKKIFQKEKRYSSLFWKAFQISRNYFLCHIHFKCKLDDLINLYTDDIGLRQGGLVIS